MLDRSCENDTLVPVVRPTRGVGRTSACDIRKRLYGAICGDHVYHHLVVPASKTFRVIERLLLDTRNPEQNALDTALPVTSASPLPERSSLFL
jgi:hypothetical protein